MTSDAHPTRRVRPRRAAEDDGAALVTVIGLSFVAMLLVIAALGAATGNLPSARFHQDNEAAVAAAQAGIDDLVFRLDRDPAYYTRSTDPDNPALDGWREVPGGAAGGPSYHYSLDTSQTTESGFITVRATGEVNDVTRTIESRIRRRGFLDQIYLTDYEVLDALTFNAEGSIGAQGYEHHCQRHRGESWTDTRSFPFVFEGTTYEFGPFGARTGRIDIVDAYWHLRNKYDGSTDATDLNYWETLDILDRHRFHCGEIRFVSRDIVRGPTHSNDGLLIDGDPQFLGPLTTSYRLGDDTVTSEDDLWIDNSDDGDSDPLFQQGIRRDTPLDLPPTNASIRSFASADGCVYRGPTYIRFSNVAGTPKMTVNSPLTPPGSVCGTGVNIDVPDNGVIYVDDSGTSCTSHPLGMGGAGYGTHSRQPYVCNAGDAFVWGQVQGQYTVAAANDVVVVSDLTYAGGLITGDDVMGLVANRFVKVFHPVRNDGGTWVNRAVRTGPPFVTSTFAEPSPPTYADGANTWNDPMIHAAVVALEHSFLVENWDRGQPYTGNGVELSLRGAIAQKSRGPVGTSGTDGPASGYAKDYVYDDRLENLSPPFFIEPVQAAWVAREFAEVDEPPFCTGDQDPTTDQCLPALS